MRTKLLKILAIVLAIGVSLLTGPFSAPAAPVKDLIIAKATLGVEKILPRMGAGTAYQKDYQKLLFDPLVGSKSDGTLSTETGLAERWEVSPDALTTTFYLRKGVKFHDGTELTAKDVKFTIEQLKKKDSTADYAREARYAVKDMVVKDPYTLIVHCKVPYVFLPALFSDIGGHEGLILPKDYFEKVGEEKFIKNPIGSGPYKFHSHVVGSHIKLEAIDRHWRDGVPRYKYVTFRKIPEESTRVAMLKTGEVNVADISRQRAKELQQAGFKLVPKKGGALIMVAPCMTYKPGPLSDIRFRKALALAINHNEIIERIFRGLGHPAVAWPGNLVFTAGADTSLKPHPYDPKEARRLIKEGGYEGHEFTVVSYPRAACPEFPQVIEALWGYWSKIGLKPKILPIDHGVWKQRLKTRKTYNHITGGASDTTGSPYLILRFYRAYLHSKTGQTLVQDPKIDKMIENGLSSLNIADAKKNLRELHRYEHNNYLWISIAEIDFMFAVLKEIPAWDTGHRRFDFNINDLIRQH